MNLIDCYLAMRSLSSNQVIALANALAVLWECATAFLEIDEIDLSEKIKRKRKWHQLLHIIMDIRKWGPPKGYNASPGEHYFVKMNELLKHGTNNHFDITTTGKHIPNGAFAQVDIRLHRADSAAALTARIAEAYARRTRVRKDAVMMLVL
jgi:hypothetical protein